LAKTSNPQSFSAFITHK